MHIFIPKKYNGVVLHDISQNQLMQHFCVKKKVTDLWRFAFILSIRLMKWTGAEESRLKMLYFRY